MSGDGEITSVSEWAKKMKKILKMMPKMMAMEKMTVIKKMMKRKKRKAPYGLKFRVRELYQ